MAKRKALGLAPTKHSGRAVEARHPRHTCKLAKDLDSGEQEDSSDVIMDSGEQEDSSSIIWVKW